jgi:hypothetical protein
MSDQRKAATAVRLAFRLRVRRASAPGPGLVWGLGGGLLRVWLEGGRWRGYGGDVVGEIRL